MPTQGEYDVFVSHASEDKRDFVEPLVRCLQEANLKVWYDDFSLDLGDSLRENIDRGLAASTYGIVVLSKAFFAKRWPERELNGLVQKAMGEGRKVILPVWHGVTQQEVAAYSLPLSDLLAAMSDEGVQAVAAKIARVVIGKGGAEDAGDFDRAHELAEQKLLSSAKRMVGDAAQVVGVHEVADALARAAFTRVCTIGDGALQNTNGLDFAALAVKYRQAIHTPLLFCALTSNLGDPAHFPAVTRVITILTREPGPREGRCLDESIWQYPAAFLVYAAGLSALQRRRMKLAADILSGVKHEQLGRVARTPLAGFIKWGSISDQVSKVFRPNEEDTYRSPLSEQLFVELGKLIGSYFVDDAEFEYVFDLFEYTVGLAIAGAAKGAGEDHWWIPPARYFWRAGRDARKMAQLEADVVDMGARDLLLGGDIQFFETVRQSTRERANQSAW